METGTLYRSHGGHMITWPICRCISTRHGTRPDAIGQHCYLFLILKIFEAVVIMELCLDMVVRLVSVYVLNNAPCSGLAVVAKAEDFLLVLCV